MLRRHLWLLILLALPAVAGADEAWQPFGLEIGPADGSADAEPVLDLSFEPAAVVLPQSRSAAVIVRPASAQRAPEGPFTVGLDVRTRREVGDEARQEATEQPALADEVAGIVKRSTFGLTGTYRF